MDPATVAQMMEVARALDAAQAQGNDMSWQALFTIGVPIWTAVFGAAVWVYRKGKALIDSEQACLRTQGAAAQWMEWACHEIRRCGGNVDTMPPIPRVPQAVDSAK
jgi:hypothetical protein